MKKFLAILLALVLVLGLVACGNSSEPAEEADPSSYEIAMITDIGSIDDKSFNQGTWEGVVAYADANDVTCKYYKPTEQTTEAYLESIQLAVEGGAKVVVTPGYLFEVPIFQAQDLYQDTTFILIDGYPNDGNTDETAKVYRTADNVVGIKFAEEQSGYLAGYAAVMEGYTKLGFMGGVALPAVMRYGYGFAQGAEAAAAESGINSIDLKYHYTGNFDASPDTMTKASSWYADGTEVIFAAGGSVGNSVMSAAKAAGTKVIGVDIDQSSESDTVITSAMKGLSAAVTSTLEQYYAGTFPGGQSLTLGAADNGVQLPMGTSKFETFTQDDYDAVYADLAAGKIVLQKDDIKSARDLNLKIVKVTVVE